MTRKTHTKDELKATVSAALAEIRAAEALVGRPEDDAPVWLDALIDDDDDDEEGLADG